MTREAIVFGAGNIGRGFLGQLFCESGYRVTFVDVDQDLVEALNRAGSYRLETVFNEDVQKYRIGPVRALHANRTEEVAAAVAAADIGATAVGANALRHVAPVLATGIRERAAADRHPLNLIICENLTGAAAVMRELVAERLSEPEQVLLRDRLGFVDTVIGRMVPNPTAEMRAEDVSLIRVEPYKELPVDRAGFLGTVPEVTAMSPERNFPLFTARKLYIHNCGHALLAYFGYRRGYTYGWEALADPAISQVLVRGLQESIGGIVARFAADPQWLQEHVTDLVRRFANRALGDTILRLGRDPIRKLAAQDRLAGAAELAAAAGPVPVSLAWGIAAGLCFDPPDDPGAALLQERLESLGCRAVIQDVTGIDPDSNLGRTVLAAYERLREQPRALPGACI